MFFESTYTKFEGSDNMILLTVGFSKKNRDIYDRLDELCMYFREKGVNIAIYDNRVSDMNYIKCVLKETEKDMKAFEEYSDMFYIYAANVIYEYIVNNYEAEQIEHMLSKNYDYLTNEDIDLIKDRCIMSLNGMGMFTADNLSLIISRKNTILKTIEDYLEENKELIIDGFITFRLRALSNQLKMIVDRMVEEFIVEKEYSEFIKLLKYFVDIQDSKYQLINVFIQNTGEYQIKDEQFMDITKEFFEDFNIDIKIDATIHDMLLSALITYAPKKIVIHGVENTVSQETIDTIQNIFADRLTLCKGCDFCKSINNVILT